MQVNKVFAYKTRQFLQVSYKQKNVGAQPSIYHGKQHEFFSVWEDFTLAKIITYHRWHQCLCQERQLVPICEATN